MNNNLSVFELAQALIAINSVNPDLVAGAAGESEIARFVEQWLQQEGFITHWLERHAGRPSVVGVLKGRGGGRSLMLNGHLDTVTIANYAGNALTPTLEDGKLYGRGGYDMKGGVAAMLIAAARAKDLGLRGDVIVACVSDEENASLGTTEMLEQFGADGGIVCEPTEMAIVIAHKGFAWADVTVHGIAAHGSRPHLGVDAIVKMGKLLVEVEQLDQKLRAGPAHPLLGTGSIHAGMINGGNERSSYPAQCTVTLERRIIPGETADTLQKELENIIESCQSLDPAFKASFELGLNRQPLETSSTSSIATTLQQAATAVLGYTPATSGVSYWADAALMQAAGIETVLFGAIGEGAHAASEWVDTQSLEQLSDILLATIKDFCV
jgi:acetylornithine deacetylase